MTMTYHYPTAMRSLATVLILGSGFSACSSTSGPSAEPVIYNLVSIRGVPLPAAADRTSFLDENGDLNLDELLVLSGTRTLFSDGSFRDKFEMVRLVNGIEVDPVPGPPLGMRGTWTWEGDLLVILRTGPPIPEGFALTGGCCTFTYESTTDRQVIWGGEHNGWIYRYELASGTP